MSSIAPLSAKGAASMLLFLGFVMGSATVTAAVAIQDLLDLDPILRGWLKKRRNSKGDGSNGSPLKRPVPSFLEAMYLYERKVGWGEVIPSSPQEDGFCMPAAWEAHAGCWLLFPCRRDRRAHELEGVQKVYAHIANAIQEHGSEQVTVGVRAEDWEEARALLHPGVRVVEMESDSAWARDSGPTFVVRDDGEEEMREVRGVDWAMGTEGPCGRDQLVARKVLEVEKIRRYAAPLVMGGGCFHVDGEGTCLVTEESLLSPTQRPSLAKEAVEEVLRRYLGVERVIWLEKGVYGDEDRQGRVDSLACFKGPGEVILHWTDDEMDPQFDRSWSAFIRLTQATDAKGRALRIHKMPMPGPIFDEQGCVEGSLLSGAGCTPAGREEGKEGGKEKGREEGREGTHEEGNARIVGRKVGRRMPASYVNFYIANEAIVVPQFMDPRDEEAVELLQFLYPERRVIGVCTRDLLRGGGNIHRVTQQQPTNQFDAF